MEQKLMKMPDTDTAPTAEKLTLTAREAAAMLGISINTMYELTHRDGFPAIRVGKRVLISRKRFIEWVDNWTGQV